MTDSIYASNWKMPTNEKLLNSHLLSINDKKISSKDFLNYIDKSQKSGVSVKPLQRLADNLYTSFLDEQLTNYYDENLENEFPEFSYVVDEYRDGLLLFDLMEKEIWERAKIDTVGLEKFYQTQNQNYLWKKRADLTLLSSTNKEVLKKALSMLKKKKDTQEIIDALNTEETVNVMEKTGVFEEGNSALPSNLIFKEGVSDIFEDGKYFFVCKISKVLPEGIKTMEECKGKLINDYQQYLEQRWVDDLKTEFTIKVNNEVLERTKKQLKS